MAIFHIAPSDSAGGSLVQALRDADQDGEVLRFRDDLSCGPIYPLDPATRAAWWGQWYDGREAEADLKRFWERVFKRDDFLIAWFSRHSASEYCFFLFLNAWLGKCPLHIIDVTGRPVPTRKRDRSIVMYQPQSVSEMGSDAVKSLLGQEISMSTHNRLKNRKLWESLQSENAPFRVITETGISSASIDHFDPIIERQATSEWRTCASVVNDAFGYISDPYKQVGNVMLHARLVAIVEQGRLLADEDPWKRFCRVRLPAGK